MAKQQGEPRDGRGVVAGEAGDEVLGASLLLPLAFSTSSRMRLTVDSPKGLVRANVQDAGHVHAAADDRPSPGFHVARNGLAGERSGVKLACSFDDGAVEWARARRASPR